MQLYGAALVAWTFPEDSDSPSVRVVPCVVLATYQEGAEQQALAAAYKALLPADGFMGHQVFVFPVPSPLTLEGYRLTWEIAPEKGVS